jgi:tetratricopeptide (TPR) repeat protein
MGRAEESLAESRRILEIDPLNALMTAHLGWVYSNARQFNESIAQCRRSIDRGETYAAHFYIGQAYEQAARYAEAIDEFRKAVGMSSASTESLAALGHAYAASGQKDEAQKVLDEFDSLAKQRYVSMSYKAIVYAGLRDKKAALQWLDNAYDDGAGFLVYLNVDPRFDILRSEPKFEELLVRIHLKKP